MLKDEFGLSVPICALGTTNTLSLGLTHAELVLVPNRWYRLWSSVDAFIKQGDGAVIATTSDTPITAKTDIILMTTGDKYVFSGLVTSGSGVLYVTEVFV